MVGPAGLLLVGGGDLRPLARGLEIREITCRSALSRDPLPGLDYGLNPYVGCASGCLFCYVPSLLHVERARWGRFVHVKRNLPAVLAREVRVLPRGLVACSTATDPYQAVEAKYRVTRHSLEVLARADWPLSVLTRWPLVLRDVDLLRRFSRVRVGFSIPTLDDEARRLLEPQAPPIAARLAALRRLADEGLETWVSFAPAYPPTNGWTAEAIADTLAATGIKAAYYRELDPRPGVREALVGTLASSPLGEELLHFTDPAVMGPFLAALGRALAGRGVDFRHFWRRPTAPGSAAPAPPEPTPPATGPSGPPAA